jgi:pimeloyl-ACP methyl ester carboxylesterase
MPYFTRTSVRLYYEDHGQGPPLLLTHGYGASTGMWQPQIEALQESYRLIPWDMRGHGDSDSPDEQALYSQDHTVEDMRALLDHLNIEQAVLLGHSLGGFLSLAFHVAYPERVRALILQGCGPGYRNPASRAKWNERTERRAQTLEAQGLNALGGGAEVRISTQRSAAGLAKAARGILAQVDSRVIDHLPCIHVPTLILAGEGDAPYLQGINYMADHIPKASKAIIANAGHGANVEQPAVFNNLVQRFLAQL